MTVDGGRLAQCTAADVPRLAAIRAEREQWMVDSGIDQWRPGSQTRMEILAQVDGGQWYQLVEPTAPEGDAVAGVAERSPARPLRAAARLMDEDRDFWGEDRARALYVHGLMVDVAAAGQGLGSRLLELIAAEGIRRGRELLRLDCAPHLVPYYRRHDLVEVGQVEFPDFVSILLERRLSAGRAEARTPREPR